MTDDRIFQERARLLAQVPAVNDASGARSFTVFRLGDQHFALETRHVLGVHPATALALLPDAPDFMAGLATHQGDVMLVVRLGGLLGFAAIDPDLPHLLLRLGQARPELAVAASEVAGQMLLADRDITPLSAPAPDNLVEGVVAPSVERPLLTIVSAQALLADERLYFDV